MLDWALNMNKAFFLDRDGVINQDNGYVSSQENFNFIEGVFEACRLINKNGYKIFVVTNQSGIGRGYYSENDFKILMSWMVRVFMEKNITITDVFHCPHHSIEGLGQYLKNCECRKPKPGMILQAATQHNIDLGASVLVGDRFSDIEAGANAGISARYLVGNQSSQKGVEACVYKINLLDAVNHFFYT